MRWETGCCFCLKNKTFFFLHTVSYYSCAWGEVKEAHFGMIKKKNPFKGHKGRLFSLFKAKRVKWKWWPRFLESNTSLMSLSLFLFRSHSLTPSLHSAFYFTFGHAQKPLLNLPLWLCMWLICRGSPLVTLFCKGRLCGKLLSVMICQAVDFSHAIIAQLLLSDYSPNISPLVHVLLKEPDGGEHSLVRDNHKIRMV